MPPTLSRSHSTKKRVTYFPIKQLKAPAGRFVRCEVELGARPHELLSVDQPGLPWSHLERGSLATLGEAGRLDKAGWSDDLLTDLHPGVLRF